MFTSSLEERELVIKLQGHLLVGIVPRLIKETLNILESEADNFDNVVLNMRRCLDIDSRGVSYIINLHKILTLENKGLKLIDVQPDIYEVLSFVKIDKYLVINRGE